METGVKVGDCMHSSLACIPSGSSVSEAARQMKKLGVGSLLVTGSDSKPFAIITKSDIVFKCVALGKQCAVGQIASKPLKTITPEADLSEAAESMGRNKVTRLVVVRGTEVVGVISEQDIIRISPSLYDLVAENARRS